MFPIDKNNSILPNVLAIFPAHFTFNLETGTAPDYKRNDDLSQWGQVGLPQRLLCHESEHICLTTVVEVGLSPNNLVMHDFQGIKNMEHLIATTDEIGSALHYDDATGFE
jgi:hypothetical protein